MSLRNAFWSEEKPWSEIRSWVVPRAFRFLHSGLFNTLAITTTGVHRMTPSLDGLEKPAALFVIWHDQTLVPLHLFRGTGITTLMSTSRNGRMFADVWSLFGWPVIFGSTNKKAAVAALRDMLNRLGKRRHRRPHARWPARAAPRIARWHGLSGLEDRHASFADGVALLERVDFADVG